MSNRAKMGLIAGFAITITILHYAISPERGPVHEVLNRAYYLPVVLAGLWFGVRGGLLIALLISISYFYHAFHGWAGPHSFIFRLIEMIMYHVIGGLTGYLSSRLQESLTAEQEVRREKEVAYNRLREKTEELFTLEDQLHRADRLAALGQLSAGLAHEIRNPLGSIKTSVEYLQEQQRKQQEAKPGDQAPDTEETPDFFGILLEETERLNRILTSFLDFVGQQKSSQAPGENTACRIKDALDKTMELLGRQLESRDITVQYTECAPNLMVRVSEAHLHQVFLNLLLNALDVIQDSGWIKVACAPDSADKILITVEDSGPGIPVEIADKIFDPFFSNKEGGTGLGLSIVERLLNSYEGAIYLEQSLDRKPTSCFNILVPSASGG